MIGQDTPIGLVPFAYESVTVAAAAKALTTATADDAIRAELSVEIGQIRVRVDGTDPTASEGHLVDIGDTIVLTGTKQITQFRGYRTGGVSGVLKVTYLH